MFGAKDDGKKRKNREPSRNLAAPTVDPVTADLPIPPDQAKAGATAVGVDDPAVGLSIEDYAKKHDLSEAEVWRMLRRGELLGRTQQGHLLVFGSAADAANGAAATPPPPQPEPAPATPPPAAAASGGPAPEARIDDLSFLPPLPGIDGDQLHGRSGASAGGSFLALSGERASSPELALLLDHLSLAKEENREILRMTQDSIKKISDMSDAMLEMKDRVIDARETELLALKEQLAQRDAEMKKLRQQNEDLEMLARTMAAAEAPKRPR